MTAGQRPANRSCKAARAQFASADMVGANIAAELRDDDRLAGCKLRQARINVIDFVTETLWLIPVCGVSGP